MSVSLNRIWCGWVYRFLCGEMALRRGLRCCRAALIELQPESDECRTLAVTIQRVWANTFDEPPSPSRGPLPNTTFRPVQPRKPQLHISSTNFSNVYCLARSRSQVPLVPWAVRPVAYAQKASRRSAAATAETAAERRRRRRDNGSGRRDRTPRGSRRW